MRAGGENGSLKFNTIKEEIDKLPKEMRGKRYSKKDVFDGAFFRVSFASDGALTKDCIELENIYLPEMVPFFTALDTQIPGDFRINYHSNIGARFKDFQTISEDVYRP